MLHCTVRHVGLFTYSQQWSWRYRHRNERRPIARRGRHGRYTALWPVQPDQRFSQPRLCQTKVLITAISQLIFFLQLKDFTQVCVLFTGPGAGLSPFLRSGLTLCSTFQLQVACCLPSRLCGCLSYDPASVGSCPGCCCLQAQLHMSILADPLFVYRFCDTYPFISYPFPDQHAVSISKQHNLQCRHERRCPINWPDNRPDQSRR